MWQTIELDADDAGRRVDQVLARRLEQSRGQARRLLEAGAVRINGRIVDPAAKGWLVTADDRVAVLADALIDGPTPTPHAPLTVIAQGEGWVMVDKAAGMPVHPLRPGETGTVLNAAVARYPQMVGVGEGHLRSGVIHRLDVDTTGCLLLATTQPTWQRLRQAFTDRRVEKVYHALVHGQLEGSGRDVEHLAITRHRPARVEVVDAATHDARRCMLSWRSLAATDAASLIEVHLETGFLHQIRAMFAHRGHPLLGDVSYGGAEEIGVGGESAAVRRPMLHAASLRVDETIAGRCHAPADFAEWVRRLGLK